MQTYLQLSVVFFTLLFLPLPLLAGHPGEKIMGMRHLPKVMPAALPIPQLGLRLDKDPMSGYNLSLGLRNYHLIPPQLATTSTMTQLEGHAHLHINGVKIQRVYGLYQHLPQRLFSEGINQITLSLNSHDHENWLMAKGANKGQILSATLIIDTRKKSLIINNHPSSSLPVQ